MDARSVEYGVIYAQHEEFELEENRYGMLIFKKPRQAKRKAMELCEDVLEKIRKEYR